jgi:2,3-bisphosphoglycerate-independent phosphoglycerate mutase
MDGYGLSDDPFGNAVTAANTKGLDAIFSEHPFTKLHCSGTFVGLPEHQVGNSEVGHISLGSGRVVMQEFTRIQESLKDKSFFENKKLLSLIDKVLKNNSALHIMGLISDGGVHSHIDHLFAILNLAQSKDLSRIHIHAILDGRDSPTDSGKLFLEKCQKKIKKIDMGEISSICGRYYAMDRDNRWERTQKAYDAIVNSDSPHFEDPVKSVEESYKNGINDEFFIPKTSINYKGINKNDFLLFFNFRPDRAKQITKACCEADFNFFKRNKIIGSHFVAFTRYDPSISNYEVIFENEDLKNTLGECLSRSGFSQLRIAETEKYAHVTFFFSGGKRGKFRGEERILVNSPKVDTYDKKPEMSAPEITEKVIKKIKSKNHDVIILNFANADMVGHTGNFDATVRAVESVDECVMKIYKEVKKVKGILIITADHGNAERMLRENFKPFTSHTANPVPFCVAGYPCRLKQNQTLSNVAPTILDILNLKKPKEMDPDSIIL